MKILVVCQYFYPETIGLNDVCKELIKKGYEVTVLTGLPNYPEGKVLKDYKFFKKRKEKINDIDIIRCFEIGRRTGKIWLALNYISFMISSSLRVLRIKKGFDYVFVYQHSPITMAIPALIYKKIHKIPLILYCFDLWPESLKTYNISEDSLIFKILKNISSKVYNSCNKILISSLSFEKYLILNFNVDIKKIKYVPQHSFDFFTKNQTKPQEKFKFLYAGNIGYMQNIDCIIKATNELRNVPNFEVNIIGYGSYFSEMTKLIKEYHLENIILVHKRMQKKDLITYYSDAKVLILTLKGGSIVSKTLPLKLQSYMSTSKPILAAIDGEARRIIEDTKCGYVVNPDNYKELAKYMLYAMNNYDLFKQMGANGRKYFLTNFTIDNEVLGITEEFK